MSRLLPLTLLAIGLTASSYAFAQSRNDPRTMVKLYWQADEQCRGGAGVDPATDAACDERNAYSQRLKQLGWCFGKPGQSPSARNWRPCRK